MTHPLLTILRQPQEGTAQALEGENAQALCEAAERHGLSAYVWHLLGGATQTSDKLPLLALRRQAAGVIASGMKVKKLLFLALDALAEEQITPTLLKGYGLGSRLWPQALLRPCSDVDLLVAEEELPSATRAATRLGLSRFEDPGENDPFAHHHHLSFGGTAGLLEIHFRPFSGFGGALQTVRTELHTLEGRQVRYLLPEDDLVYLAAHATQHLFLRLGWLVDLKFLLERNQSLDWARVEALATEAGLKTAVYTALVALEVSMGGPVPAEALERLRPALLRGALAKALFTPERLVSAALAQERLPAFAVRMFLSDSARGMARHAALGAARSTRRAAHRQWLRFRAGD